MKPLSTALLLTFALLSSAQAQENQTVLQPLHIQKVNVQTPTADKRGLVTLFFTLAPGHHAYIQQFKLELDSPKELHLSEPLIDPIVDFYDPVSKKQKKGTEGTGTILSTIEIPDSFRSQVGDEVRLKMTLTYQACTKEYCLFPTRVPVEATLYMSGEKKLSASEKFAIQIDENFWLTLLFVFFAGILTSFTPCIFPMIPITLAVLGAKDAGKTRLSGFILSLAYVLGIALTYAILGVIAAITGALFGSTLGHPVVAVALAVVFLAMAFSMYGHYEIKLPDSLTNRLLGSSPSHSSRGIIGAFFSGLVAGVVASPCVGPVLVSILAYVAKSQDISLGFILLFIYALGFGQIFLVLGTFTQLFNRLPRSGPWLERTKFLFGTMMIAMALYVLWPVVKPLIWSAPVAGSTADADLAAVAACTPETIEKKNCDDDAGGDTGAVASFAKPVWKKYDAKVLADAIAAHQPVIIDFKADWCLACKELEYNTFSDPRVLELGKKFLWLYFDATQDSPELAELRAKYEILGLPFVMFYDARGDWRKELTLTGFEKADAFLGKMKSVVK